MIDNQALLTIFMIFTGAAVLATLAMFARQTILTAYLLLGLLLGPVGFDLVEQSKEITDISQVGITFLLFLLGLDLAPNKLLKMVKPTALPTLLSCLLFASLALPIAYWMESSFIETLVLAVALMFSSTIIGLKLLPTTVLHHKPTGEVIISVLLLQDILAIFALFAMHVLGSGQDTALVDMLGKLASLPFLMTLVWLAQRYILIPLLHRFSTIREYVFLLMIGWCLGVAELTGWIGLSHEIGAFIAGVFIAFNPIALYVAGSLKPLRDFFLIVFFVSLGWSIQPETLHQVIVPSAILATMILVLKPYIFRTLLSQRNAEEKMRAKEVGVRLGQGSEFSLLLGILAYQLGLIGSEMNHLIQITVFITFIVSPYLIARKYPSPIAWSKKLMRD